MAWLYSLVGAAYVSDAANALSVSSRRLVNLASDNYTGDDTSCGTWISQTLVHTTLNSTTFTSYELPLPFNPDACLEMCLDYASWSGTGANCTAFTAYDRPHSNCMLTDSPVHMLTPVYVAQAQTVAHETNEEEEEDFSISMVMCNEQNWPREAYPRVFENVPCSTWIDNYLVVGGEEDQPYVDPAVVANKEQCLEECLQKQGCSGVSLMEVEDSYLVCQFSMTGPEMGRMVNMDLVRELSPPEDQDGFMDMTVTSFLVCDPTPYEETHDHPHEHKHVHEDGTSFVYTHWHPHSHGDSSYHPSPEYDYNPPYNASGPTYHYDDGMGSECPHSPAAPGLLEPHYAVNMMTLVEPWISGFHQTVFLDTWDPSNAWNGTMGAHEQWDLDRPVRGVGIVIAIGMGGTYNIRTPISVRVKDDFGTLVAARDFPADSDGLVMDICGGNFTGPCETDPDDESEVVAMLKINLSEPKHMMHYSLMLNGTLESDDSLILRQIMTY